MKPKKRVAYMCVSCGDIWHYYRKPTKCHICEETDFIFIADPDATEPQIDPATECYCYEIAGDNPECPVHGEHEDEE